MALHVPSETVYEMILLNLYQWPDDAAQVVEIVRGVRERPGSDWQLVTSRILRLFMDTLPAGDFDPGPHGVEEYEMTEVYINDVAYVYVCDDDAIDQCIAFFGDPTHEAPVVCARKLVINIEDDA